MIIYELESPTYCAPTILLCNCIKRPLVEDDLVATGFRLVELPIGTSSTDLRGLVGPVLLRLLVAGPSHVPPPALRHMFSGGGGHETLLGERIVENTVDSRNEARTSIPRDVCLFDGQCL